MNSNMYKSQNGNVRSIEVIFAGTLYWNMKMKMASCNYCQSECNELYLFAYHKLQVLRASAIQGSYFIMI